MAATIQPTIAYRINDKWSAGAGLTANYGFLKIKRVQVGTSKSVEEQDGDWQFGGRLGVMYEPSNSTRIGLVWTSEVDYDFKVDATVRGILPGRDYRFPVGASVIAPQQVMFSVYQKLSDRWAMMGNLGWQEWSKFSQSSVEINGGVTTSSLQLQDTWHIALGAQYSYNDRIKVNTGLAYDSSFYKHQNQASFALPSGATWRFGTGVQYALSPKDEIGVSAEYLRIQSSSVPSALVSGSYDHPEMFFMSLSYTYRF